MKDKEGEPYHVKLDDEETNKKTDKPEEQKLKTKKTTVKTKSGKEKEIEFVEEVPKGYTKLEGAMTAPSGYTWYSNGKSLLNGERKTILIKDKPEEQLKQMKLFNSKIEEVIAEAFYEAIAENRLGE